MSKNTKILVVVILVILVIAICCVTAGKNSKNENKNTTNNETSQNVIENTSDEINDATMNENVSNTVENDVEEEPIIENVTEVQPQGTVYESNSDMGTTDKKQEAIDLVKQTWGEDDTVTFRCDSINSKGEYIIAVVSKQSATVKNYFKVNLNTKTVEIDY